MIKKAIEGAEAGLIKLRCEQCNGKLKETKKGHYVCQQCTTEYVLKEELQPEVPEIVPLTMAEILKMSPSTCQVWTAPIWGTTFEDVPTISSNQIERYGYRHL